VPIVGPNRDRRRQVLFSLAGAAADPIASATSRAGVVQVSTPDVRDELLRLEMALASRDPSGIAGGLMTLIAEDFVEFGTSGRIWTTGTIRDLLEGVPAENPVAIEEFDVAELADGVALATYLVPGSPSVNRSSIWLRRDGRWQLRFHQGTTRPDER
jgi:glyoxylase I family protein